MKSVRSCYEWYNSYIDVEAADAKAPDYLNHSFWDALDEATKSQYLLQAFRVIQQLNGFIAPSIPEESGCLPDAQLQIAMNDIQYGISMKTYETQEIKSEKAGPVETQYFESASGIVDPSIIPVIAIPCLQSFGYTSSSNFNGMSTVRTHR